MKAAEMRDLTLEELDRKIKDLEEELFRNVFGAGRGTEPNAGAKRKTRRDLARAKTVRVEVAERVVTAEGSQS